MKCHAWIVLLGAGCVWAQTDARGVARVLEPPLHSPDAVAFQLRQYLLAKVPKLSVPRSSAQWTAEVARLRRRILEEVVFRGWPKHWVDAPTRFEDLGLIAGGEGYRMRRLRYLIVPGFYATAVAYEPDPLSGGVPAVLNVNGHGLAGKALEYKQKRCIQQARSGVLALNLEWIGMGELAQKENTHWFAAHLDLAGARAVGLFYLAMRRGLDYLWDHPQVDRRRIAMTGLSGGGWQTIFLSALDERIALAVPVAGYSSVVSRIERAADVGDIEQNPADFYTLADYAHLTAMRAPKPTLLIYNAEDDCCFRAPLVKPFLFNGVRPFFALFGAEQALAWHENIDPADHNYQLDNRRQLYRFLNRHFGSRIPEEETGVDRQILSFEQLVVGLPPDNLTVLGLARQLASGIERPHRAPAEARSELRRLLRYQPVAVSHAWALANTKAKGLETIGYRFDFTNGLSATGVWLKAVATPADAPATLVLHDQGKKAAAAVVSDRVNRGEQVLAADLLFFGDAAPEKPGPASFTQLIAGLGERALGLQVAQLLALAEWMASAQRPMRLEADGIRAQVVALTAAALQPERFSHLNVRHGMRSLGYLFDTPVEYRSAPELFAPDLYRNFDLDTLAALGPQGSP